MSNAKQKPITFALYFGNRGFFPESLIAGARADVVKAVTDAGYNYIIPDENMTRYGAVETPQEGRAYAAWLKSHEGEYDGVILSLPNFGDENGAIHALRDCDVPILIHAFPDEIGKMDFAHRRDSYCGEAKIMILEENVSVNGEICTMRGKKLRKGDTFDAMGESFIII
jgi:L-fucose isomerase-like protein